MRFIFLLLVTLGVCWHYIPNIPSIYRYWSAGIPYCFYLWKDDCITSKSSQLWIIGHIITAVFLLTIMTLRAIKYFDEMAMEIFSHMSHYCFCFLVVINSTNLGIFSPLISFIINIGTCFVLTIIRDDHPNGYLGILMLPVVGELVAYLRYIY